MSAALVLVGAPGAGKTTVGRLVAERLGVAFTDTDQAVEEVAGKSVAEVFFDDGEPAFRALEREQVAQALTGSDGVVAVGGGAVLDPDTRLLLREQVVVWLQVAAGGAAKRVGLARDRPVLALNPRASLVRLLDERRPLYAEVATAAVETDDRTAAEVAEDVLEMMRQ